MKKVTMNLLTLLLLISIPITGYAYYQYLNVPAYTQATDYTCWATCVAMVLHYNTGGSYVQSLYR